MTILNSFITIFVNKKKKFYLQKYIYMNNIVENFNNLFGLNNKTIYEEIINYDYYGEFIKDLNYIVSFPFESGIFVKIIVIMILVFYSGNIWNRDEIPKENYFMKKSMKLPKYVTNIIKNKFVKIFILSLIIYKSNKNPLLSLLVSLVFTYIFDLISSYDVERFSSDISVLQSKTDSIDINQSKENTNSKDSIDSNRESNNTDITITSSDDSNDSQIILEKENNKNSNDKLDIDLKDSLTQNRVINTASDDSNESKLNAPQFNSNSNTNSVDLLDTSEKIAKQSNETNASNSNDVKNVVDSKNTNNQKQNEQCDGLCSKISYNELVEKVKSDEFSQKYFDSIKDCMVVDLLQKKNGKEVRSILKKLDLTHNDIDGPIGTAYVNYSDAISRVNI